MSNKRTPEGMERRRAQQKKASKEWRASNPGEAYARVKRWRKNNPEKYARMMLRAAARRIGLDPDMITAHFDAHDGLCDICGGRPTEDSRLSIDHNHETGAFRGLLCRKCNSLLGMANDDIDVLLAAVKYLENG